MEIYIHKDNEDYGPYSAETAREYVSRGVFQVTDWGWYAGAPEWKPLGEILGTSEWLAATRAAVPPAPVRASQNAGFVRPQSASTSAVVKPARRRKSSFMIALNLFLILVAATAAFLRFGDGWAMTRHWLAELRGQSAEKSQPAGTPAPADPAEVVQPAPALASSTPVPAATPEPPRPFDAAALAAAPGAWPRTLRLKQGVEFPAVFQGHVVGSLTAPTGTEVNLVSIEGEQLLLEYRGGNQKVSWRLTDLEEQAGRSAQVVQAPSTTTEVTPTGSSAPPAPDDDRRRKPIFQGWGLKARPTSGRWHTIRQVP